MAHSSSTLLIVIILSLNALCLFGVHADEAAELEVDEGIEGLRPSGAIAEIEEPAENKLDFIRFFAGLYYQNSYRHINNYLVDHLETNDVEQNLAKAEEKLEAEKKKFLDPFNKHLIEALKQFLLLKKIVAGNACNWNSYAILLKNDRATRGRTHKLHSKLGLLTRVDTIIYDVAIKHAIECQAIYPQTFNELRENADQDQIKIVETFIDALVRESFLRSKGKNKPPLDLRRREAIEYADTIKKFKGSKNGEIAYNTIAQFGANDPNIIYLRKAVNQKNAKLELNREKIEGLVKKYLVQPCEYFVQHFGPNVFVPAYYDMQLLEKEDRYRKEEIQQDLGDYFVGWIRFRVCNVIITREHNRITKEVANIANKF